MLQDIQRGAPTEIDAICGAIVEIAQKHEVPTPANWACWQLVRHLPVIRGMTFFYQVGVFLLDLLNFIA